MEPSLTGKRFNRWLVIGISQKRSDGRRGTAYLSRCDCGTERVVNASSLRAGSSRSCGCWKREVSSAYCKQAKRKHGHCQNGSRSKEWRAWHAMIRRCKYPSMERFNCYGGRGITVCPKWQESFEAFLNDVGFAPSPKHTLGRINNDGNYEPNNVEWQTMKQQSRNSRHNRLLTFEGETLTIGDWAIRTGINRQTIQARIDARGWSVEKALSKVPHRL